MPTNSLRMKIPDAALNPTNRPTNGPRMKIHTGAFFHILRWFFWNSRKNRQRDFLGKPEIDDVIPQGLSRGSESSNCLSGDIYKVCQYLYDVTPQLWCYVTFFRFCNDRKRN